MKRILIELIWGIIFSIVMLGWLALENYLGWHDDRIGDYEKLSRYFIIPATLVYVFALIHKRNKYYLGKMTWLQGFVSGIFMSLFVALLNPLVQYVFLTYISPYYLKDIIDYTVEHQLKTLYQAENYYSLANTIIKGILIAISMGTITSAFVALFVRKGRKTNT